jgi:hypothetical protein
MKELFQFKCLDVFLVPETKSLKVQTKENNELSLELLFELDSTLNWAFDKIEINSIFLTGIQNFVSLDKNTNYQSEEYIIKLSRKINAINLLIMKLPQTVILDIGHGSSNIAFEVGISADIILAHRSGNFLCNYLTQGFSPFSLQAISLPNRTLDFWVLSNKNVSTIELLEKEVVHELYDDSNRDDLIRRYLRYIYEQLPVTRIQTKLALKVDVIEKFVGIQKKQEKILTGTLVSHEWKKEGAFLEQAKLAAAKPWKEQLQNEASTLFQQQKKKTSLTLLKGNKKEPRATQ